MPAQIRRGVDASAGVHCSPTVPSGGSINCFTNYAASVKVGDSYIPHCLHGRAASGGHSRTFINYSNAHRNGDAISCGDRGANGSRDVYVGTSWGD